MDSRLDLSDHSKIIVRIVFFMWITTLAKQARDDGGRKVARDDEGENSS